MNGVDYSSLFTLVIPHLIVVVTAFVALLADLRAVRRESLPQRLLLGAAITTLGCASAIAWLSLAGTPGRHVFADGMIVTGPLVQFIQQLVLLLTIFTAFLSLNSTFTEHVGEYFALLLFATAGMMFLVGSHNLLVIFISLELLSLCLYVLTAFNKRNVKSAEAALKYFLFGGMCAAFLLFGLSLLYGLSGEINLGKIAAVLKGPGLDPLMLLAFIMVIIGFGFKIAAVPFHLWAPDAYEGAPTPSAAFIASGSKVASFFILAQFFMVGFSAAEGTVSWPTFSKGWVPMLAIVAAASILLGNLAAIVQTSVRRLLAYSAVAQGGYMLIGIIAQGTHVPAGHGLAALIYYVATYAFTIVGAFGVVQLVETQTGHDRLSAFAGFARQSPVMALCMAVFLLSLAGIPPLAGFFGKFYLFVSALANRGESSLLWLVILALGMSAVSLYYYLQVLKQIMVKDPQPGPPINRHSQLTRLAILLLAALVVLLGCAPNLVLDNIIKWVQSSNPGL